MTLTSKRGVTLALGIAMLAAVSQPALADAETTPTVEELYELIQQQQQQIESLQQRLDSQAGRVEQTEVAVEATAEVVEQRMAVQAEGDRTHVGGYGEMHINRLENQSSGEDKNVIDFHRFVLFFGHEFSDKVRFNSEVEIEHALVEGGEESGEVELEQAYVEFDLNERLRARGGLFLLPVGILNLTHEPTTFYGVERSPVAHDIIPSTWWAGGASLLGELGGGFSFDLALHSGLNTSAEAGYQPRDGRQKVSEAVFNDAAVTGRLKYTAIPGLELAASVQYQGDVTQGSDPSAGSATLFETHADWREGPFGLRALYARWELDGAGPAAIGAGVQEGFYLEPSWRFTPEWGVFARYNQWDNAAGDGLDSEFTQWDLGVNYWPHPRVVIKADYQDQDTPPGTDEFDGINLGIGYLF